MIKRSFRSPFTYCQMYALRDKLFGIILEIAEAYVVVPTKIQKSFNRRKLLKRQVLFDTCNLK